MFKEYEKSAISHAIKECINKFKIVSYDVLFSLELINRLDGELNKQDLTLILYSIEEEIKEELKCQFTTEYLWILEELQMKISGKLYE